MHTAESAAPGRGAARLIGLDLLRFVAVVLVLGRHIWSRAWPDSSLMPGGVGGPVAMWQRGGWVGVDLFFVLSGFLVSGLLFTDYKRHGRLSIAQFCVRRAWKIYPPFLVLIASTVIAKSLLHSPLGSVTIELLFLQSYRPGLWGHTWSLAVEEHFYLILPLVLAWLIRRNQNSIDPLRRVLTISAALSVAALSARLLTWHYVVPYDNYTHLFPSHLRMDSLFFGVALSYVHAFHRERMAAVLTPWRAWLIVGGCVLLSPAFAWEVNTTPMIFTVGLSGFYLGSGLLLVGVLLCDEPRGRLAAAAATLGAYSYSIYLWHVPVIIWLVPAAERTSGKILGPAVVAAACWIGSLVVGVAMAKAVELPALRLRDRWFPRDAGGVGEAVRVQ